MDKHKLQHSPHKLCESQSNWETKVAVRMHYVSFSSLFTKVNLNIFICMSKKATIFKMKNTHQTEIASHLISQQVILALAFSEFLQD